MKIEKLSKVKMVLRIALPCLALSVIMSACSNDDITEDMVVGDSLSTGLVFNASFPALEDGNPSTRVGLNESLIPINPNITEPLIWIAGDKLSFNFVANGTVGQVIEYEVTNVGSRGRSCSLRPVSSTTLADGTYTVYAVTPHSTNNFLSGLINLCNVDLSGQSQPEVVDSYKNLSNYLYVYAKTTVVIQNGAIISGGNNLSFAIATSLLRFNVTNATGEEVTVDKITVSQTGSAPAQFYTYRQFDPTSSTALFSGGGSGVSSLTLETDKPLSDGGKFDAYLSIFPTEGFSSVDDNKISIRVDYIADGENKHKDFEWSVSAFSSSAPYAAFRASARFLFNLNLMDENSENEQGDYDNLTFTPIEYGDYYFTPNSYISTKSNHKIISGIYFLHSNAIDDDFCPVGWSLVTHANYIHKLTNSEIISLFSTIHLAMGYAFPSNPIITENNFTFYLNTLPVDGILSLGCVSYYPSFHKHEPYTAKISDNYMLDIRCMIARP
jgi:hypothetical protein